MAKFVAIGERLSTTAPIINKAFTERERERERERDPRPFKESRAAAEGWCCVP